MRYIGIVLIISVLGYVSLIIFAASPEYCKLTSGYADASPCNKFSVSGRKADILLVGDSSLLYGINPEIVARETGISVYNDGIVGPVFPFSPAGVIDRYLATNRRPRAIVIYLSPWSVIDPGAIHDPVWYPLGVASLHYPGVIPWTDVLRARPSALVELPQIAARNIGFSARRSDRIRRDMDEAGGFFDYDAVTPPARRRIAACPRNAGSAVPSPDRTAEVLRELKARYQAQRLPVYFYVAPVARCGNAIGQVVRAFAGIADNRPMALDDALFVDDGAAGGFRYVHANAQGVERTSHLLGQFILARQGRSQ